MQYSRITSRIFWSAVSLFHTQFAASASNFFLSRLMYCPLSLTVSASLTSSPPSNWWRYASIPSLHFVEERIDFKSTDAFTCSIHSAPIEMAMSLSVFLLAAPLFAILLKPSISSTMISFSVFNFSVSRIYLRHQIGNESPFILSLMRSLVCSIEVHRLRWIPKTSEATSLNLRSSGVIVTMNLSL